MRNLSILFAGEKKAAALLDIKPSEFRGLVEGGALPRPANIGGYERWDVEQLQTIARGAAAEGGGIIEW